MKSYEFNPLVQSHFNKLDYSGLILIPRKIYYEWSRYLIPESDYFKEQAGDFFLLPQFNSKEETEEFIRLFYDLFFQHKLRRYSNDPVLWPVQRSYEMFLEWFEVRITTNVTSLKCISMAITVGGLSAANDQFSEPNDYKTVSVSKKIITAKAQRR
jgi:hypothetical protein